MAEQKSSNNLYLQKAVLEGYKTIKHVETNFQPGLNIIIGKNGTGKTNLFTFLYHALQLNYEGFLDFQSQLILSNGKKIELHANNDNFRKAVRSKQLIYGVDDDVNFSLLVDSLPDADIKTRKGVYESLSELNYNYVNAFIQHGIPSGNLYFIETSYSFNIKLKGGITNIYSIIRDLNIPDFIKNIFSALSYYYRNITSADDVSFKKATLDCFKIISSIKPFLSEFSDIMDIRINENFNLFIDRSIEQIVINNFFWEFKVNDNWLPFSSLSDGTKRMFYIITEIVFQGKYVFADNSSLEIGNYANKIILLEEPELGIHPHQLERLMQFLKEQAKSKQIIISTHSPIVLDMLGKDNLNRIQIATLTKKGTQLRKLSQAEQKKARIYIEETGLLSDYWRFSDLEA